MCLAMDSYPWMMMATTRPHPHPNPPLHPTMEEGQSHATAFTEVPVSTVEPKVISKVYLAKICEKEPNLPRKTEIMTLLLEVFTARILQEKFLAIYLPKDQGHTKEDEKWQHRLGNNT